MKKYIPGLSRGQKHENRLVGLITVGNQEDFTDKTVARSSHKNRFKLKEVVT